MAKLSKMEQMKLTKAKRAGAASEPEKLKEDAGDIVSIGGQNAGKKAERRMIRTSLIAFNENNDYSTLDTEEDIRSLAENIKQNGLEHNLVVAERPSTAEPDKHFVLISGERRLRAIRYVQESDPMFYPEVACYVIPESEFLRPADIDMSDAEYRYRVEMIKLDTANLQVRGGTGDSAQTTKAMNRYKNNVMAVYLKSEREANAQLLAIVGEKNKRFFERSQQLHKNLLPELYALYVDKETDLPQQDFLRLTSMTEEEQGRIYQAAKLLYFKKDELGEDYETYRSTLREIINKQAEQDNFPFVSSCETIIAEITDTVARNEKALQYSRAAELLDLAAPGVELFTGTGSLYSREEIIALAALNPQKELPAVAKAAKTLSEGRLLLGNNYLAFTKKLHQKATEAAAMEASAARTKFLAAEMAAITAEAEAIIKEARRQAAAQGRIVMGPTSKEQRIRSRGDKLRRSCATLTTAMSAPDMERFAKQLCANTERAEEMLEQIDELLRALEDFREMIMEAQING